MRDRTSLWSAAENAERRRDARVAREVEVALPCELTSNSRRFIAIKFAKYIADRYNTVVDVSLHSPRDGGDIRSFHAHIMMATREISSGGFGAKTPLEQSADWLRRYGLPSTIDQLGLLREAWAAIVNEQLTSDGVPVRVDHRSHRNRNLNVEPNRHVGRTASMIARRHAVQGSNARALAIADRRPLSSDVARRNAARIIRDPAPFLDAIEAEHARHGRRAFVMVLKRYVGDDEKLLRRVYVAAMPSFADREASQIVDSLRRLDIQQRQLLREGVASRPLLERKIAMLREGIRAQIQRKPWLRLALQQKLKDMQTVSAAPKAEPASEPEDDTRTAPAPFAR